MNLRRFSTCPASNAQFTDIVFRYPTTLRTFATVNEKLCDCCNCPSSTVYLDNTVNLDSLTDLVDSEVHRRKTPPRCLVAPE